MFKQYWLLIKEDIPSEVSESLIDKFKDSINFNKPQSFNFEVSISHAYKDAKHSS